VNVTRHLVAVGEHEIHYAQAGEGDPVLLLHQTPRSWDEYRDVLPLLGRRRRAIAIDMVGFGSSSRLPRRGYSIELWATLAFDVADALGLGRFTVVGHHTGGYVAIEMAASHPERLTAAVLSCTGLRTAEERLVEATERARVDDYEHSLDGSHLLELWRGRAAFYPPDLELLERFMVDCLKAGSLAAEGHRVVARYASEERVTAIACPALIVCGSEDFAAYPTLPWLRESIPHAGVAVIEGGMVPLPDGWPDEFAAAVERFLDDLPGGG
jgi:pimeloyl-ACP methyl ester carboxylesterase